MDAHGLIMVLAQAEEQGKPSLESLPMLLMAAGVILLVVVLMGHLRKNIQRRSQTAHLEPKERIQAVREEAQTSSSFLEKRTAHAEEVVRELTAMLDNRSEKLEILIQHADERIERLERLTAEAEGRMTPRHTAPSQPASETSYANDSLKQQIYDLADQGQKAMEIAQRLGQHTGKVELILALRRA